MKKLIMLTAVTVISLTLCIGFAACSGNYLYFLPEIKSDVASIEIEYIDNQERDYEFLDEKLSHELHLELGNVSCAWQLKTSERVIGWIITSIAYENERNGEIKYGISADKSKGFENYNYSVKLDTDDEAIFQNIVLTPNVGTITFAASNKINYEDKAYVVGSFSHDLTGVDPKKLEGIKITFSLKED